MKSIPTILIIFFSLSLYAQTTDDESKKEMIAEFFRLSYVKEKLTEPFYEIEINIDYGSPAIKKIMDEEVENFIQLMAKFYFDNFSLKEVENILAHYKEGTIVDDTIKKKYLNKQDLVNDMAMKFGEKSVIRLGEASENTPKSIYENNESEDAALEIEDWLETNPGDYDALAYKGLILYDLGDLEGLELIEKIIEQHPEYARGYQLKGNILHQQRKFQLAKIAFEKALSLDKRNPDFIESITQIYFRTREYEKSIEMDKILILKYPNNFTYYLRIASAYRYNREPEKAKEYFNKTLVLLDSVLEKEPDYVGLMLAKASIFIEMSDFEEADKLFTQILELNSEDMYVRGLYSDFLLKTKKYTEAILWHNLLIKDFPENVSSYNDRGYCLLLMKKYDEALEDFNTVIEKLPTHSNAFSNRGFIKMKRNDLEGAEKDILRAIELDPSNQFPLKNLGLLRLAQGNAEIACKLFSECIEKGFTEMYDDEVEILIKEHCK